MLELRLSFLKLSAICFLMGDSFRTVYLDIASRVPIDEGSVGYAMDLDLGR